MASTSFHNEEKHPKSAAIQAFSAGLPIMLGYIATGIPCGLLEQAIGLNMWMAFVVSATFYSGVGQFMICNMVLAGFPPVSVITSTAFASSRQMLYSAALSKYFAHTPKLFTFFYSATVTDESFGLSVQRFEQKRWDPTRALYLNLFCMASWTLATVLGVAVGNLITFPQAVASFAMTCIFIFMLCMQRRTRANFAAIASAAVTMIVLKSFGITAPAVLVSTCVGVAVGLLVFKKANKTSLNNSHKDESHTHSSSGDEKC